MAKIKKEKDLVEPIESVINPPLYVSPIVEEKVKKKQRKKRTGPIRCFNSIYFELFIEEFLSYMNVETKRIRQGKIFKSRFTIVENKRGYIAEIAGKRKWFKDSYAVGEWIYINSDRIENTIYPKYDPKERAEKEDDEKDILPWSDDYGRKENANR